MKLSAIALDYDGTIAVDGWLVSLEPAEYTRNRIPNAAAAALLAVMAR
jgi:hypothetical protein